jgi:hypothetical protein
MDFKKFLDNHIRLLADGDAGALVESDYHDDAIMFLMLGEKGQLICGKESLKEQFDMYLKNIYRGFIAIEKVLISDDSICLQARINTTNGELRVWDALYMNDGKIFRHYSGMM